MDDNGVALTDKGEQRPELRTLRILAGHVIGENPIDWDLLQVTFGALIERASSARWPCLPSLPT
jgi:hypothetical protein